MSSSILGRAIAARAAALMVGSGPTDDTLIDLSGEFPAGSTATGVRQQAISAVEKHLCDHYTRRPGIAPLCRAVATRLANAGVPLTEDNVVVSGSVSEARYVAVRALAVGKTVYLPQPAPAVYDAAIAFAGALVHRFDTDAPPDIHDGLLIVANPNPATGQVLDLDALTRLAQWAERSGLTVIADESGAPLLRPEIAFAHFAILPGMFGRTLTIGSFAGTPGLSAWHVSWFGGPKTVFNPVRDLKQSITICTAAASQYAALAAASTEEGDALAQEVERQESIIGLLERRGLPYRAPHTTAFVVADVTGLGGGDAVASACRDAGVRVSAGSQLGAPGALRIGVPTGDLGEALARLDAVFGRLEEEHP